MDAVKFINENTGQNEGNAITYVTMNGNYEVLDSNNLDNPINSGVLSIRFDEITYY
jgi:hypothetical protein